MCELTTSAWQVKIMHRIIVTLILFLSINVQATLPNGCVIEDVKTETVQVKNQAHSLVYIQNAHATDVFLASENIQLTTKLVPLQWSVFLPADSDNTEFSCVESKPGSEQRVSCMGLVKICRLSGVEFAGSFEQMQWLVLNESLENSYDLLTLKHIALHVAIG